MERPILFSTPMVQAILDGRKTMTRRIVKPQPPSPQGTFPAKWRFKYWAGSPFKGGEKTDPERFDLVDGIGQIFSPSKNYGKPGDVIWVRESCQCVGGDSEGNDIEGGFWLYKADGDKAEKHLDVYDHLGERRWKPSIHMPKSACRIWLEVVSVRVERLHEISDKDAIAEGVEKHAHGYKKYIPHSPSHVAVYDVCMRTAAASFETLWQSINGPDSWEANPWVWVIEFKRIEKLTP